MIRTGCIHSEYARITYFYLLPALENTRATLGDLATFNFYLWNSREMVQVPSSKSNTHSKSDVDVDALLVDVSMSLTFDGFNQNPNEEMVHAVPKNAPNQPELTLTNSGQSSVISRRGFG